MKFTQKPMQKKAHSFIGRRRITVYIPELRHILWRPAIKHSALQSLRVRVGRVTITCRRLFEQVRPSRQSHPVIARTGWMLLAACVLSSVCIESFNLMRQNGVAYARTPQAEQLLPVARPQMAAALKLNPQVPAYEYNQDYKLGADVAGDAARPKFSAQLPQDSKKGITITEPTHGITVTMIPKFGLHPPRQDQNRIVYPLKGMDGQKVYSLQAVTIKEDIILNTYQGNELTFDYKLSLPAGTQARSEKNGSVGVYGVDPTLLGSISTGSEKDAKLLDTARTKAPKNMLLFTFPAPYIKEANRSISKAQAWLELRGDVLTLHAKGLKNVRYPISIDPTIYIETARKLMKGNNETNIDFDLDNELIQKGKTTGARIDNWEPTMGLNGAVWDQGVVAAGGYVYMAGGESASGISTSIFNTTGSANYTVPAGVSSVTVKLWGAGGGGGGAGPSSAAGGAGGGGGFIQTTLAVTAGESLDVYVGAGGGGGAAGPTYAGDGGGGGGSTRIARSGTTLAVAAGGGGGGAADTYAGGAGGGGGGATGVTGAASGTITGGGGGTQSAGGGGGSGYTAGAAGTLSTGGEGGNAGDTGSGGANNEGAADGGSGGLYGSNGGYAGGGGGGGGYYGGGGGASEVHSSPYPGGGGGGGGSSYANGSATTNTAGSGTTPGNSGDSDRLNAGQGGLGGSGASGTAGNNGIAYISYTVVGTVTQSNVYWAQLQGNRSVGSPNPGSGVCDGWCTSTTYGLPEPRRGFSMVAYNGFLYVIGGVNASGVRQSTVYIAKLGTNGEPQLWHPTDSNPNNWAYWYQDTGLNGGTARSYESAYAYNNRMYMIGGQTNANPGGVATVEYADILPSGQLGAWATGTTLPSVRHGHTIHVYNDVMYLIGGNSNGTLQNTVYYNKLNTDGSMNNWVATNSFNSARSTLGGSFSTIWGAYIYLGGGCLTVNASGYCTSVASDTQLASINADGSIAEWNTIQGLTTNRIGYNMLAWQNGLYRIGGCMAQNSSTGICSNALSTVDYGVINQDGDASTVSNSSPSGIAPCSGTTPINCNLPPAGTGAGQGGQMASMVVVNNGFIYNIGGCVTAGSTCSGTPSGNVSYAELNSDGNMTKPGTCSGTYYGLWCVDSTNTINGANGLVAAGATTFNGIIYVIGGVTGSTWRSSVWRVSLNANGSLAGAWASQSFASLGAGSARGYLYAFTRANPAAASTNPGNLYMLGGCSGTSGIGCSTYYNNVVKCNIATAGTLNSCTTTGQMQIDADNVNNNAQGLGLMAGATYANRIYLVGGSCASVGSTANAPCGSNYAANRKDTIYAKIDNSNNIVDNATGIATGSWKFASAQMNPVRRRAAAFGYNGYIYSLAGYSGTTSLQDLLYSKIDVSTGDMGVWSSSGVVVTPRWDLKAVVSNGYVYAIGGCGSGAAPSGCTDMQEQIQMFQLYNNDSGAPVGYNPISDDTFTADTNRWGASATVLNGYVYVAGGCISATDCTTATANVQYAPINPSDGSIGTWASTTAALPAVRAWGKLVTAGGYLYYLGGQDSTATNEQSTVYYAQPNAGNIVSWATASGGIGNTASQAAQPRTKFGAAVWNNRIYVVGGLNGSAATTNTVFISPQLQNGGDIPAASWIASGSLPAVARQGNAVVAYANNLYTFGGYDGTNYLNDSQYTQINSDGTIDAWLFSTSLPTRLSHAEGFAYNGYIYVVGGRSAASSCQPNTLVTPVSANTTIASGNNPTGIGEWYETNKRYTGDRYGAAVAYTNGKAFVMGGGCTAPLAATRGYISTLKAQPQVAKYSRMIDTDSDVFPNAWLMNGLDNSIGARWKVRYRSMTNPFVSAGKECITPTMTTWGQETNFGDVTLGKVEQYIPKNGSGINTNCARFFNFVISIDSSQAFGYPEDVTRGPTIADLSLFYTADASKRLMHGRTFLGGEQQPLDTPCRRSNNGSDPLYSGCALP